MTFSLVARCSRTGQLGVGALTAMMGVGKLATFAEPRVGAIASQATLNPYLGYDGLRLLSGGATAEAALAQLIDRDPGRDVRQAGIVDASGGTTAWTGEETIPWSGHMGADGVMAQGNRLVGPETLTSALDAFHEHSDRELAERLLLALEAGESTGADTGGARSGTVYVMDTEEYPLWDLRIDHADDPAVALRELFEESREDLIPKIKMLPTRDDPLGEIARRELAEKRQEYPM